jgi:hypothetical protein
VVIGKWLLKNKKVTTGLKCKIWTNPQNKIHKKSHELRLIRPQTWHKSTGHMYLIFLTPLPPSVEKIVNLLHRFNQIYKPSNKNVVSVDHHSTAWQCISPAETVKGFKKCCISNAVDEIDGDML